MRREPQTFSMRALLSATALSLFSLSGCSTLDSLDPTGLISRAPANSKTAGSDQAFPNLGSVPARPPAPQRADREGVARTLTADRQNAQYTDEVFRRTPEAPPPPPASTSAPTSASAPTSGSAPTSAPAPLPAPPVPPVATAPPPPPPPATAPVAALPSASPAPQAGQVAAALPPPAPVAQAPLPPPLPSVPAPASTASSVIAPPGFAPPAPRAVEPAPLTAPTLPPPIVDAPQPRAAAPVDQPLSPSRPPATINASGAVSPVGGYLPSRSATVSPPLPPAQPAGVGFVRQPLPTAPPPPPVLDGRPGVLPPAPMPAPANLDAMLRQTFPDAQATPPRTVLPDASAPTMAPGGTPAAVLYFQGGSVALSGEDRQILSEVAKVVRERGAVVQIVGHASRESSDSDPIRRRGAMLDLSAQRAQAVQRELTRLGVATTQMDVQAMGDARPEFDDTKTTGVAGNRRVEILIRL